ncbi:hypothetical protein E4N62_39375 [Streptomyces sp. MNU76]|uniref:beta/gamma crystallin domain-containing protein n=1 Tax=Streptomyces sp. MNU76 TaxID=2560026 RepID=UPI001E51AFC7|nr:beta/gamma crystallin domain-containing protein [Streptomyces sp. MNU76]MCC9710768.1 hypothetical protein [Streptomyces sp. MNU76]
MRGGCPPAAYSVAARPTWFDHAGELVVVDGPITWETPWHTEGGFSHRVPAGRHPVYVGCLAYPPDGEDPDALWLTVTMLVIPLAEPARIETADGETSRMRCCANAGEADPLSTNWGVTRISTGDNRVQWYGDGRWQPAQAIDRWTVYTWPNHPGGVRINKVRIL